MSESHDYYAHTIGVCMMCDASATKPEQFGARIVGQKCMGCGGPIYELVDAPAPVADATTIAVSAPKRDEWVIRLRFSATREEAHTVLDKTCDAIAVFEGGVAQLRRDE